MKRWFIVRLMTKLKNRGFYTLSIPPFAKLMTLFSQKQHPTAPIGCVLIGQLVEVEKAGGGRWGICDP